MSILLAVDIGGTKTLFQLSDSQDQVIVEQRFVSQDFASFEWVLTTFLNQDNVQGYTIDSACFAVAGPVSGRDATVTNLPWQFNADTLAAQFNIKQITLCNDFAAVAYGIAALTDDDVISLQTGDVDDCAPRAVIGAGTGLGQAVLIPTQNDWQVFATEGGHTDFAPTDDQQIALLQHLMTQYEQVSYERLVSGVGLVDIYEFLAMDSQYSDSDLVRLAMDKGDPAAAISHFALTKEDPLAQAAMNLFIKIYGAQAGNLALTVLPRAGLYIAGSIAVKNRDLFRQGPFMSAFRAKGKMASLMKTIPVKLILQENIGLMGARLLAGKIGE